MKIVLIILGIIILVVISAFIPEPQYKCKMCKDNGQVETSGYGEETVMIDCPDCVKRKEDNKLVYERNKKVNKIYDKIYT